MSAAPRNFDWLVARPIAHRGLHARGEGRIENSLDAARAALARSYAIECDVQMSADGEIMVFHDARLDRLTAETGPLAARSAKELAEIALKGSNDTIPTLVQFLDLIAGRVPLIVELKSAFDGNVRLAHRVAEIVRARAAPIALKSFDPDMIAALRASNGAGADVPLGLVAEAHYLGDEWAALTPERRAALPALVDYAQTRPDFLSFRVDDLPHAGPHLFRAALAKPVMSWTICTPAQRARAALWADQMVFEGFTP